MPPWVKYLFYSLVIHLLIIGLLGLSDFSTPKKQNSPSKSVKINSYLYQAAKPVKEPVSPSAQNQAVDPPTKITETVAAEPTASLNNPMEAVTNHKNTAIEEVAQKAPEIPEQDDSQQTQLNVRPPKSEKRVSVQELNAAANRYLQNQVSTHGSWSDYQARRQQEQIHRNKPKSTIDSSYFPTGTNAKVVGQSVDGSTQVKMHGTCYNIAKDQFGDNLWTPTPCPKSADPNRQLLRDSLRKYGLTN